MSRRSRVAWYGAAGLLVVLGIAAAVAVTGTAGQVLAFVLIGLGLVLVTSLLFLEVGLSEDRDRAREEQQAAARRRMPRPFSHQRSDRLTGAEAHSARPKTPGRLDRSRGHRRRLR